MSSNRNWCHGLIVALSAVLVLTSCGKEKVRSDEVDVSLQPDSPIVVIGDGKVGETTITAPWIRFSARIHNMSDQYVFIQSVMGNASIAGTDGVKYTKDDYTFSLSSLDYTTDTDSCTYTDYDSIAPNQTTYLSASASSASTGNCTNNVSLSLNFDSLPKNDNIKSYRYKVDIRFIGWFVHSDGDVGDRFDKTVTIYTQ